MKRLSIYLDTSVVSFLLAEDAPEKREVTIRFFERRLGDYDVAVSELVLVELSRTTDPIRRSRLLDAVEHYSLPLIHLDETEEAEVSELARLYVHAGVVPAAKRGDAIHLAIGTVRSYDVLLSWNYRHLANVRTQAQMNAVNVQAGYFHPLRLLTPLEVMYED